MKTIYLDHAATSPMCNASKDGILSCINVFGNPSSSHIVGNDASKLISDSRSIIADSLSAPVESLFFTSGGTEANNWALSSTLNQGSHLIISKIEHHSVLKTAENLLDNGVDVTFLSVDKNGQVDPEELKESIRDNTKLVSIMMANNEIGTVQAIDRLAEIVHSESNALFHTDAVQAWGKIAVNIESLGVDLLSVSGHKINGPKGVGVLYVNSNTDVSPMIFGGHQEGGKRAGTENVLGIVGMACAARAISVTKNMMYVSKLARSLKDHITKGIPGVKFNGDQTWKVPGILNVTFDDIESKRLVSELSKKGICISSGSACNESEVSSSHVLDAIGLSKKDAHSSVRFSLSKYNDYSEITHTFEVLKEVVEKLRRFI
jgi:cysteine desulfurase